MAKRDRLDIIYDILKNVRKFEKIGPTLLQNKSNLSSQMFKENIHELIKTNLIEKKELEKSKSTKYYFELTKKGNEFINKYNEMKSFVESFGL